MATHHDANPLDSEDLEIKPTMRIFYKQILQWLHCVVIYDETKVQEAQYQYRCRSADGREKPRPINIDTGLIEEFQAIFTELSKEGHDEGKFEDILGRCPSKEGGEELFTMWGLSSDQGLRIVGRLALLALADQLNHGMDDLLAETYLVEVFPEFSDSDSDTF